MLSTCDVICFLLSMVCCQASVLFCLGDVHVHNGVLLKICLFLVLYWLWWILCLLRSAISTSVGFITLFTFNYQNRVSHWMTSAVNTQEILGGTFRIVWYKDCNYAVIMDLNFSPILQNTINSTTAILVIVTTWA